MNLKNKRNYVKDYNNRKKYKKFKNNINLCNYYKIMMVGKLFKKRKKHKYLRVYHLMIIMLL